MKTWEWWVPWVSTAGGIVLTWLAGRRSQSFKEMTALKEDYKTRLQTVEKRLEAVLHQQDANTKQIAELTTREAECQKTVQYLKQRDAEFMRFLKEHEDKNDK